MQDFQKDYERFAQKEFPGFCDALVARQNRFEIINLHNFHIKFKRQLVRSLHTLMNRAIIEKLCAAEIKRGKFKLF